MSMNKTHSPHHHKHNRSAHLHWYPQLAKENLFANANLNERPHTKTRLQEMTLKE